MTPLEQSRLEKALADHGFDLTPILSGIWIKGRSTQHPSSVWLTYLEGDRINLASAGGRLYATLGKEGYMFRQANALPENAEWEIESTDYATFYHLLGRIAALARSLPNTVAERFSRETRTLPTSTEAERLVVQRIGQNLFRDALIDYWQGRCAVTGLDITSLLRASHIKPWAACSSDEERLDVFNGMLLAPHLDALFDGGWITISETGEIQVSSQLTAQQREVLGLASSWAPIALSTEHQDYLAYHRDVLFKK